MIVLRQTLKKKKEKKAIPKRLLTIFDKKYIKNQFLVNNSKIDTYYCNFSNKKISFRGVLVFIIQRLYFVLPI